MQAAERSSSVDLSSAPASDSETPFGLQASLQQAAHRAGDPYRNPSGPAAASATVASGRQDAPPVKKPRKPRTTKPKADPDAPKPARKPRASNGTGNARKRQKVEEPENHSHITSIPPSTNLQQSRLVEPYQFPQPHHASPPQPNASDAAKTSQNGFSNSSAPMHSLHSPQPPPQPQTTTRTTSMYDPIRGSITVQETPQATFPSHVSHTPPRPVSRSGASPISSLIDPPAPSMPTVPSPLRTFEVPTGSRPAERPASPRQQATMDIDSEHVNSRKTSISKKPNSEAPTRQTSPKPRAKEQPPPMPTGSGLLSASLFGGELSLADKSDPATTGPNIVLHIDLRDPKNKVINFARLAEEKYGFAALYPRQAAQRERMARMAAAGAALERSGSGSKVNSAGESGDEEGSVDIDRESDNDGDVAMGGVNGTANSGTEGEPKKVKRRKKVEEYDLDDDFVDDSEQVWEAQAATSKEGFFVYCGPLVAEGEKPTIERYVSCSGAVSSLIVYRADGTMKRPGRGGGRGRGGGPGSRGGRGARSAAAAARDSAATSNPEERPKTGPGSRGGKITRRPRAKMAAQDDRSQAVQSKPTASTENVVAAPEVKPVLLNA
jgi:hypothetical protein